MARTAKKEKVLTPEEKLAQALVPDVEQPYRVPENWCWVYSPCVFDIEYGKGLSIKDLTVAGYPVFGANGQIGYYNDYMFEKPQALMSCRGAYSGVMNITAEKSYVTSNSLIIRGRSIECDPQYICYLFESQDTGKLVSGSAQPQVTVQAFQNYPIPLIPLAEQQRIVDRIESLFAKLDEAKEKAQAVVDGFEDRRAAILHKAFTGELTEAQRKKQGDGYDGWESVTLNDIVNEFKYGTSEKSDYSFTGMPVLRIPNIGDDGIDFSDIKKLSSETVEDANQIHENDILIIRSNGSRDLVGKCALVPQLDQEYAYASFLIRIKPSERVRAEYLVLFLNSADARAQMFAKAKSSAGINNINSKELGAVLLKLPELWEQEEITHQVSKLLLLEKQAKEAAEQVIDQIDAMKKSILARAFRGELGTNDPADESAEELLKRVL